MRRHWLTALAVLMACATGGQGGVTGDTRHDETRLELPTDVHEITTIEERRSVARTMLVAVDDVWAALPRAYEELGISVKSVDTEKRLVGNRNLKARGQLAGMRLSRALDCGSGQMGASKADVYTVTLDVVTTVRPGEAAGTTLVETWVAAFATPEGVSANPVRCSSTGRLEDRLVQELHEQLASGS